MARFNPVTEAETPAATAADQVAAPGTTTAPARSKPAKSGRKPKVLRSGGVLERIHALPERALGCLAEELGRSDLNALRQEFAAYAEAHPEFSDWRKAWAAYKAALVPPNIIAVPVETWTPSPAVAVPVHQTANVQLSTFNLPTPRGPRIGLPQWRRS